MSGTYSNWKTLTVIRTDGLLCTMYKRDTSTMYIRDTSNMYTRNIKSLKWFGSKFNLDTRYSLLDSDTKAKNIATEIANFVSTLDTPQAKAAFDRKVKNAFQVKNPKPKGIQLYQKEYMTLRQGLKQKQYLSLGQSLGAKTYEPKAKSLCRKQSQSQRPRVYARARARA